jgi:hypothetical protein
MNLRLRKPSINLKIYLETVSLFSHHKNALQTTTFHHAFHHVPTTKKPRFAPKFRKTPPKKTTQKNAP